MLYPSVQKTATEFGGLCFSAICIHIYCSLVGNEYLEIPFSHCFYTALTRAVSLVITLDLTNLNLLWPLLPFYATSPRDMKTLKKKKKRQKIYFAACAESAG